MAHANIVTLTGGSAAGKSTIARELLAYPSFRMISSVTTRRPREGDIEGEYRYVQAGTFDSHVRHGEFLWKTNPHTGIDRYGTLEKDVRDLCEEVDATGIMILVPSVVPTLHNFVKRHYPDVRVRSVFVYQHDMSLIRDRLRERGMSEEAIENRLKMEEGWEDEATDSPVQFLYVQGGVAGRDIHPTLNKIISGLGQ